MRKLALVAEVCSSPRLAQMKDIAVNPHTAASSPGETLLSPFRHLLPKNRANRAVAAR